MGSSPDLSLERTLDSHSFSSARAQPVATDLSDHYGPPAAGPRPDRPAGPARPTPSGYCRRSRHRAQRTAWLNAYLERGLDGLQPRHAPGAKPKLTPDLAPSCSSGLSAAPSSKGWTGPIGLTPNWPTTSTRPRGCASKSRRCKSSAPGTTSAPIAPPTAFCVATPSSKRPPAKTWPP